MSDPRTFASLSSSLLARKGHARPAMRPQGYGMPPGGYEDLGWNDMGQYSRMPEHPPLAEADEDATAFPPPVVRLQADIAEGLGVVVEDGDALFPEAEPAELTEEADLPLMATKHPSRRKARAAAPVVEEEALPVAAVLPPAAAMPMLPRARSTGTKAKAAFTLRLDPERHLRLRLASAVAGRSAQTIVTEALDALLRTMPEIEALAARSAAGGDR